MSSIDQRVVEMKIDNKQFESGVSSSVSALDKLKAALRLDGAAKGFSDIDGAAKKVNLSTIGASVDEIKGKFSALSIAGIAALSSIAASAVDFGKNQIGKMFGGMSEGFAEYELKMGSIQTIMAGTGASLEVVNGHLDALNAYSDRTIYSFSDMTESIGKFTNAGVELPKAVDAIKGISNAAALAGADASKASIAMYNFAQSMSTGFVNLQDWKSIELAGMATTGFKQELINTAEAAGTLTKVGDGLWKTMEGTEVTTEKFNYTLADQWATADVLTDTLARYSDENTELGKSAYAAAQDIKTFSQMMDTVEEAVGSGWAKSFEILIGDFEEAKTLFSTVGLALTGIVEKQADNRNKMFQDFVDLGGRDDIINGFKNLVAAVQGFIKPIKAAWEAVFGPKNTESVSLMARVLSLITGGFLKFTEVVKMGANAFGSLKSIFTVLFSVLKGGGIIIGAILKGVVALFGFIANLVIGIGKLIGALAEMGIGFASWLLQTEEAQRIFKALKDIWDAITSTVRNLGIIFQEVATHLSNALTNLRHGFNDRAVLAFQSALSTLGISTERAARWANWLVDAFNRLRDSARNFIGQFSFASVASALEDLSGWVSSLRDKLDFKIGINTSGLDKAKVKAAEVGESFGWIGKMFKWIGGVIKTVADWVGPVIMSIADFVGDMVAKVADYLRSLTFTEFLALVNTGFFIMMYKTISGFFKNLSGLGKGFKEALDGIGDALEGFAQKEESIATKILKIAIAVAILAGAAYLLSEIDTVGLVTALGAMAVMLAELGVAMKLMSKIEFSEDAKVIKAAIALTVMSLAILILAKAAKDLSSLSWNEMAKGLVAVSVLLAGLALFTKFSDMGDGQTIRAAIALVVLAGAIRLLATSVEKFGNMNTETLIKGLGTVGLLLAALVGATKLMNNAKLMSAAVGLLIISGALLALSFSLKFYANLDWNTLVDGLAKMGVALIGIGIAARFLPSNLPITAAGLILVAGALALLVPSLALIGSLPVATLIQGVLGIAGALVAIAAPMMLISNPAVLAGAAALVVVVGALYVLLPILITLGTLPWEVLLQGLLGLAGIFLILGAAGLLLGPAVPVLVALTAIILALGLAVMIVGAGMALFGLGFAAMVGAIVAGGAILISSFQALIMLLPLLGQQIGLAVVAFAVVIRDAGPQLVLAIETVIRSIITAGRNLIPDVIALGIEFVMGLANAVRDTAPQVAQRGLEMLLDIMQKVRTYVPQIVAEFLLLLLGILQELRIYVPQIVDEAMKMMVEFLAAVADNIGPIVDEATRLMVEFMDGIERNIPDLVDSGVRMVKTFIREVGSALLGGVPDLIEDGKSLAGGIIDGLIDGLWAGVASVGTAAKNVASEAWNSAMSFLGINSPSKKFIEIGKWTDEGFAKGLSDNTRTVTKASEAVGMEAIFAMKKTIAGLPDAIDANIDMNPTIRPILDLSELQTAAQRIDPMLQSRISATTTSREANAAEQAHNANRSSQFELGPAEEPRPIQFYQYNTSPKALDRVEIYRQTNNQLSLLKEEFNVAPR